MSTVLSRDEVQALLPAYALGSLDADERAAVDTSLVRYPDMHAELAAYSTVALGLGATAPQRTPPAELKAAILAKARSGAVPPPQPRQRPTWWQRLIDSLRTTGPATRLAFAALIVGAALTVTQLVRIVPAGMQQLAEQQRVKTILASATESVHLKGTTQIPNAWALIRYNRGERMAAMWVGDLPALPSSKAYQLWLVDSSGTRWSGALFNTSAAGQSYVLVNCPKTIDMIVRFGVSIEPASGSRAPTGPPALRS